MDLRDFINAFGNTGCAMFSICWFVLSRDGSCPWGPGIVRLMQPKKKTFMHQSYARLRLVWILKLKHEEVAPRVFLYDHTHKQTISTQLSLSFILFLSPASLFFNTRDILLSASTFISLALHSHSRIHLITACNYSAFQFSLIQTYVNVHSLTLLVLRHLTVSLLCVKSPSISFLSHRHSHGSTRRSRPVLRWPWR